MVLFKTVNDYLETFKVGDLLIFGGRGIMNGISENNNKHDVYRVHENTTRENIVIRGYRGRTNLIMATHSYDQEVALLSKDEYGH